MAKGKNLVDEMLHITGNNTPQFMGQQFGAKIEEVRKMIKQQKRVKGFKFDVPNGSDSFNIQLSGTARIFLGFALLVDDPTDPASVPNHFTLTINNEIIIEDVNTYFFTNYLMDDEYYFIPRPLSGTDQIKVDIQNDFFAQPLSMIVYYI